MITNNVYSNEGFGENFKFIIYTIMFAEYLGEEFHYTPLRNIQHNYDADIDFVKKKENLINIINHYPIVKLDIQYERPDRFDLLYFFENNVEFCYNSKTLKKLKSIFREANKDKFDKTFINIAIHIRKMNKLDIQNIASRHYINDRGEAPGTDIPENVYKDIITQLKNIYKNCVIHIYSQTNDKNLFNFDDVILHIDESLESTFIDFVFADVLVVAPSTFSYTAGFLSNGIVYYIQNCNRELPNWSIIKNYISTMDRYSFFIKTHQGKMAIYYDTKVGEFYRDIDEDKREYINIHDYLK